MKKEKLIFNFIICLAFFISVPVYALDDEKEAVTAAALSGWFYVNPYYTGSPSETIRFFNELGNPVETSIKVTYAAE